MRNLLVAATLMLAAFQSHASEARAQLEAFLSGLTAMSAQFEQHVRDENNKLIEASSGQFLLQRPGSFRWSYKVPYLQEIIGANQRVWVYDSELEQVSIKPMDDALGSSPALLLISEKPLDEIFKVRELGARDDVHWLELEPLNENGTFASFRIGMADGSLRLMELLDNFGQRTQLKFSDVQRNPELDANAFSFTPPPGTDVVGEQPAAGN